jgi:SEC-C motif-containing protein
MRSRYAAFVEADLDYIRDTLHPGSRKDHDERATRNWATRSQWLGLEIRATDRGGEGDADGVVEFVARYRYKGEVVSHHERARFVKEDGRWWFVDSETPATEPVVRESPRVGRNEACPCGSGRKHKKCCGT